MFEVNVRLVLCFPTARNHSRISYAADLYSGSVRRVLRLPRGVSRRLVVRFLLLIHLSRFGPRRQALRRLLISLVHNRVLIHPNTHDSELLDHVRPLSAPRFLFLLPPRFSRLSASFALLKNSLTLVAFGRPPKRPGWARLTRSSPLSCANTKGGSRARRGRRRVVRLRSHCVRKECMSYKLSAAGEREQCDGSSAAREGFVLLVESDCVSEGNTDIQL